jgi:hypothetical protein
MARKLLLNQTVSRPMLYALAQEKISTTPREVLDELAETVKDFFDYIPKVTQFMKDRLSNLMPESDAQVLRNYGLTRTERCFWFTDKDSELANIGSSSNERDWFVSFEQDSWNSYSSDRSIGRLGKEDLIALYYTDMVSNGIDVMKYLFVEEEGKDYNGKTVSYYNSEQRDRRESIGKYNIKFFEDNGLDSEDLSFEVPYDSNNRSCHQRARLITEEQHDILAQYKYKLGAVRLVWHKALEQMKKEFQVYKQIIKHSKTLEAVANEWPEAEEIRHKLEGTGTALALSTADRSVIQEGMARREAAKKGIAFIVPKPEAIQL